MISRDRLRNKWYSFTYNFGWSNYVELLDGWMPRLSFAVPVVGYLIIFNDSLVRNITFLELTSRDMISGLSGSARLKFLYLGLIFLGTANILYRWKKPYVLNIGRDQFSYVEAGFKNFTVTTFVDLHGSIRHTGYDAFTRHGKYYDSEWESFLTQARGVFSDNKDEGRKIETADSSQAKSKHEDLLRSILIETFFRENTQTRKKWLIACILIAAIGYLLIAVPSIDLFAKVMVAIVRPFFS